MNTPANSTHSTTTIQADPAARTVAEADQGHRCGRRAKLAAAVLMAVAAFCGSAVADPQENELNEAAALARINMRRAAMGLGPVAVDAKLQLAARRHSDFLSEHNLPLTHEEVPGLRGYVAIQPFVRVQSAGYDGTLASEDLASGWGDGTAAAEDLIAAIYHRFSLFDPGADEVGIGAQDYPRCGRVITMEFGASPAAAVRRAQSLAVYPADRQDYVPYAFDSDREWPDPVGGRNRVGYPVSVHANGVVKVDSFTLSGPGGLVVSKHLESPADAWVPDNGAAIIPMTPLEQGVTYTARFVGRVDGKPVSKTWQFTTAVDVPLVAYPSRLCIPVGQSRTLQIRGGTGVLAGGYLQSTRIEVTTLGAATKLTGLAAGVTLFTATGSDGAEVTVPVTVAEECPDDKHDADRIFAWAEARYPHLFASPASASGTAYGYYFRYYPNTKTYLGEKDGRLDMLVEKDGRLVNFGAMSELLPRAQRDGY